MLAPGEAPDRSAEGIAARNAHVELRNEAGGAWAWLTLPALVFLGVAFFLPILILASNSLHADAGFGSVGTEWTLENYKKFLFDPFYLGILLDTFLIAGVVVTICAVIGYPVAYLLVRSQSRWKGALIFLVVSPLLVSAVIRNLGWIPILGNNGLINWLLVSTGLLSKPVQFVGNELGVVIGLVHALLPFMILSLMTVIQRIEPELEEASIILGATPMETFWRVVFPLSRPGLLAGYLLVFTVAVSAFVTPGMLGGKRVLMMAIYIDQQIHTSLNYGFGSTVAVVLMIVAGLLSFIALRMPAERT